MPAASTPSKRVALAPISINVNSPLHMHKHRLGSLPLTPSLTPKLLKSASAIVGPAKVPSARKLESFSDYKITNSKNVKADLAATKLKLRLQMAFYKLKAHRDSLVARSPPAIRVSKTTTKNFTASANVNLQKPKGARLPLLNTVAAKKGNLRLYHIKNLSSFHNAYPHKLPLTSTARLPPVHKILKTPIKTTTRSLVLQYHASQAGNSNSDETIDESVDEKKKEDLGSSPLRNGSFGTPISFSVAKSLLQLGLGYY